MAGSGASNSIRFGRRLRAERHEPALQAYRLLINLVAKFAALAATHPKSLILWGSWWSRGESNP